MNGNLEEDIYIQQPEGFIAGRKDDLIYGLKQASWSWNIRFDQAVKLFGFIQNLDEPCVYKKCKGKVLCFLVLYVDDILLIGNDVVALSTVKVWLASTFNLKDLGEASYILGIKLIRDWKRKNGIISSYLYR